MGKFDGLFDDVVVNAKAAASAVSKKASFMVDSSKLKITAAEMRSEINTKLRDLGALTYKEQTQGADLSEQVKAAVAEITELKENLSVINQNIEASKSKKKCPGCGASVPKNSLFCNICGSKLGEDEEPAYEPETAAKPEAEAEAQPEKAAEENPDAVVDADDDEASFI